MISIKNLCYSYPRQTSLFDNLDLSIDAGNIVGLLGKNGSGKTTFLNLLSGLLFLKTGELEVSGYQPKSRHPAFLEQIFVVPEEFYLPLVTIKQYIRSNSGFYPAFDHHLMTELLNTCELSKDHRIHRLSLGQKKKFLITFALATKCKLLLLDEPTNSLDIPSKSVFRKMVAGSLDENQLVIISTHQVKDVENLIDRIIVLDQGQIILDKPLHEISKHLQFSKMSSIKGKQVIYSETVPGGYHVISANVNGDTSIDIELLFNAVTSGKQIF